MRIKAEINGVWKEVTFSDLKSLVEHESRERSARLSQSYDAYLAEKERD